MFRDLREAAPVPRASSTVCGLLWGCLIPNGSPANPARLAVRILQFFAHEVEADVPVNKTKQVVFGNLIFETEVIKQ